MEGSYKNRYDVTILINGLPLVQIELKRRGFHIRDDYAVTCKRGVVRHVPEDILNFYRE